MRIGTTSFGFRYLLLDAARAPLGQGRLDLDGLLDRIAASVADADLMVENWVPATGVREEDVARDEAWVSGGVAALRARLAPGRV
jgi:hypothetical protein